MSVSIWIFIGIAFLLIAFSIRSKKTSTSVDIPELELDDPHKFPPILIGSYIAVRPKGTPRGTYYIFKWNYDREAYERFDIQQEDKSPQEPSSWKMLKDDLIDYYNCPYPRSLYGIYGKVVVYGTRYLIDSRK